MIVGLAVWGTSFTTLAAAPVFDDLQLVRGFAKGTGGLADADKTLESAAIEKRLKAVASKTVDPPEAATPCTLGPEKPLYDAVVPAVVAVGSVFKCDKCNDWHVGQMASGWLLSPDGLVVTNHHVLERAPGNRYGVMTSDGEVYGVVDVVAADVVGMVSRTSPGRPAVPGKPSEAPPPGGEQMIFKECVSADTLRALLGGS